MRSRTIGLPCGACLALMLCVVNPAAAQTLDEGDVARAIAAGQASRLEDLRPMRLAYSDESDPVNVAFVYTPQLRVALAAAGARAARRAFGPGDVTTEMARLQLYVVVPPRHTMSHLPRLEPDVAAVTVVALPPGTTDTLAGAGPLWASDEVARLIPGQAPMPYGRVFGLPMAGLRKDLRFVVVFEEPVLGAGGAGNLEVACWLRGEAAVR